MRPTRAASADRFGRRAEALCSLALRLGGYRVVAVRARTPLGEIDIVARRGETLAMVEVKARPDAATAARALQPRQCRRLARAAAAFLGQHPELADLAVKDLARWKDWKPLDQLIAAYGRDPWDSRSAKEKIVEYALSCRKDIPAGAGGKLPDHAVRAQSFLDSLDPEFVQSVKQSGGGLAPPSKTPSKPKQPDTTSN